MDTYEKRRQFSDQFLPQIKCLLGTNLIEEATHHQDMKQAIDVVMPAMQLAVRVRRAKWMKNFGDEFVLRHYAPTGVQTEYEKLQSLSESGPSHILNCFVSEDNKIIKAWLIDVAAWNRELKNGSIQPFIFKNADGMSNVAFPCRGNYSRLLSVD